MRARKRDTNPCVTNEEDAVRDAAYHVEEQVGFLIRRAHQRASAIFGQHFKEAGLSPVQFAALAKIRDEGRVSQNQLGRLIYVDPATIAGVINRLATKSLIRRLQDPTDNRRILLGITSDGLRLLEDFEAAGHGVSEETFDPLSEAEQRQFLDLLLRLT